MKSAEARSAAAGVAAIGPASPAAVLQRVAFLGLGLIGGSVARALRAGSSPDLPRLAAWTPSGRGPARAFADGIIDEAAVSPEEAITDADLIVLAGPPMDCLALLDGLAGSWRGRMAPGATVTDVASTKAEIVARAGSHGLAFVGGHPMAGREAAGYAASEAGLFRDRPWVVVPGGDATEADVARVEGLARSCGARPMVMDAATHDAAVAGISHLPLILAAALVEAVAGGMDRPDRPFIPVLTASGWRDMTRLARGDVTMGVGIMATNGPAIAARIRDLQAVLDAWLTDLDGAAGPDVAALGDRLAAARDRLGGLD